MDSRIKIIQGDITTLKVDAIVNAANNSLTGGGGVDGAIHYKAGKALTEECRSLGGAKTGEVKVTNAYDLPCKKVFHAVGPVWYGGDRKEEVDLRNCISRALELLVENDLRTIAFPCISTGAYRYPFEKAIAIILDEMNLFLNQNDSIDEVSLVAFSEKDYKGIVRIVKANYE